MLDQYINRHKTGRDGCDDALRLTGDESFDEPDAEDGSTRFPFLTYTIAAACIAIYAAHAAHRAPGWVHRIGMIGQVTDDQIWDGHYAGLLWSAFAHGSLLHLALNMVFLIQLGGLLEVTVAPLAYLAFTACAAVVGSGVELACRDQISIGYSAIIYAIFGLLWAGRKKVPLWSTIAVPLNLGLLIVSGVACVIATRLWHLPIGNDAHGAGMLFGLSVGYLFFSERPRRLWAVPLTGLVAVVVMACVWMPWSPGWNWWRGTKALSQQQYSLMLKYYEKALNRGRD